MRRRDDEDLALDRIDSIASAARGDISLPPPSVNADAGSDLPPHSIDELRAELTQLRECLAQYPDALDDQIRAAREVRAEARRIIDEARARITELEGRPRGTLRRGTSDPGTLAFERERLKAAERQLAIGADRERELAANLADRGTQEAEHEATRARAAAIETALAILRQHDPHGALDPSAAPYLTLALGPLPQQPRARRTWHQAAQRIEAYRFEQGITDPGSALGPRPTGTSARAHWQRAQRDIKRAQRALGHAVARGLDHQL